MTEYYIPRSLEPMLAQALGEFPVVVLACIAGKSRRSTSGARPRALKWM
ncbi:MAG: hypothetical protein WBR35_01765 [Anaerolineae bacterium]